MAESDKKTDKGGAHKSPRRQGRTIAFQVLFSLGFDPQDGAAGVRGTFRRNPAVLDCQSPDAVSFAEDLVMGVTGAIDQIDGVIGQHSDNWKIARIAKVELAILRLALYEILHRQDIPLKVAINEAIELAKGFGDENSRAFVNGILDAVARAVDQGKMGPMDKKMDKKMDKQPEAKAQKPTAKPGK